VHLLDAEVVEQVHLRVDHVGETYVREIAGIGLAAGRVDRTRSGAAITPTEIVAADDEELVGVEGFAGSDERVPPALVAVLTPQRHAIHRLVAPGGVLAAAEGVEQQHGVVFGRVEFAVGLISHRHFVEALAVEQMKRVLGGTEGEKLGADVLHGRRF